MHNLVFTFGGAVIGLLAFGWIGGLIGFVAVAAAHSYLMRSKADKPDPGGADGL